MEEYGKQYGKQTYHVAMVKKNVQQIWSKYVQQTYHVLTNISVFKFG